MDNLLIQDTLFRIKKLYEKCDGNIYLSFSGGKDSTVLAHLIIKAIEKYNLNKIDFVFCNTGLELIETIKFISLFNKDIYPVKTIYPNVTPLYVFEKYGKPAISKENDDRLKTLHNYIFKRKLSLDAAINESSRIKQLFGKHQRWEHKKLAKRNEWAIHYILAGNKISNKCCLKLKKDPFVRYERENKIVGKFLGVRQSESILRKTVYNKCFVKSKDKIIATPLYDWSNQDIDEYIQENEILLSKAYTKLNFKRTGCFCCPYNYDCLEELEVIKKHHYNQYLYGMRLLEDVLILKEKNLPKQKYENLQKIRATIHQLSLF